MTKIAYLGLGTMGLGMVKNLIGAGHQVTVWNRSETPLGAAVESGATSAPTVSAAVAGADVVMYCLSDDAAVNAVVLGDDGLASVVDDTSIVIDLSTISPEASAAEREAFEARGVRFLDAPVFGSRGEANNGGLWIVVGGDAETFEEARGVLEPVSETVHLMGPGGSGVRMKLVGNLVVASQLLALGESLTLAAKAGLDLHKVLGVLKVTDFRSPIFDGVGPAVLADDYSPSFALKLMQKDSRLIQAFASDLDMSVPSVSAAAQYVDAAMDAGWAEQNASAMIKAVAAEAGVSLVRA
ncbi:NAD(P)-dependent oxidoreductase [Mycetocola miduiensis]|uniref:3-hydroxyisobutyrate dehydrogenase/glyoxylate/succinic semialdehyde reductase n=1 Tax=Mycetocola miduiensis TaxID=995034 RepID=A0A1I5C5K0_9MICO|nr:NAD(P)-dependent oxidoreductase [Mycetocola miduiensis]SFN82258.1 3-hydroxyisobutyrate dehydrogenase/glyoxylate/succinic semialdehyde reductase [Mycetocola miduiensis]